MATKMQTLTEAYQEQPPMFRTPHHEQFPFTWYRTMRAEAPVFYDESLQAWSFFLYEDIDQAASDFSTFSSQSSLDEPPSDLESLIRIDPPRHHQLRSLVSQVFTTRSIALLAPMIKEIANEVLDPLLQQGHADAIEDIAYPLPIAVISRMLGVPVSDNHYLKPLIEQFMLGINPETREVNYVGGGQEQVRAYFHHLIEQRRRAPTSDLISDLVQAEIDGERMNDEQLVSFCRVLYAAGFITTVNLIGSTLLCFDWYPDVQRQVRAHPDLLAGAIEEVLRLYSPVQSFPRLVTRDIEVRGHTLQKGQSLFLWYGSANRDEHIFHEPERFDLMRTPNKHLAFGHGIHSCLGAPLARLEGQIVIETLLERMGSIQLELDQPLEPMLPLTFYGVKHLPIAFTR